MMKARGWMLLLLLLLLLQISILPVVGQSGTLPVCDLFVRKETTNALLEGLRDNLFSIGYAGYPTYIDGSYNRNLQIVAVQGLDGGFMLPTMHSVNASLQPELIINERCPGFARSRCPDFAHALFPGAWPLVGMAYLLLPYNFQVATVEECLRVKVLQEYMIWIVTSSEARKIANDAWYVEMPAQIRSYVLESISELSCNGKKVANMSFPVTSKTTTKIVAYGSTLLSPLFTKLNNYYTINLQPSTVVNYNGGDLLNFSELGASIDFAGVDVAPQSLSLEQRTRFMLLPIYAAPVVVVAHLDIGVQLNMTASLLDKVLQGKVACWDNEMIVKLNPNADLPKAPITRVVRNHSSGSTLTLTNALALLQGKQCESLPQLFLCSDLPSWPAPNMSLVESLCPCNSQDVGASWAARNVGTVVLISLGGFALVCIGVFFLVGYIKSRKENLWKVSWDEVSFPEKPEVLGQGSFGVVLKVHFRSQVVACKRLVSPSEALKLNQMPLKSAMNSVAWQPNLANRVSHSSPTSSGISARGTSGEVDLTKSNSGTGMKDQDQPQLMELLIGRGQGLNKSIRSQLMTEVKVMISMRHPNLCPIMGACFEYGKEFLLMQYFEYGSIRDMLNNRFAMTFDIQMDLISGIAAGMQYVHLANPPLIHKDLKAANVLVDAKLTPKISDFGMTSARSKEGERVGTIFWNAPELLDGRGASTATDVYAFAITMYEIFHPLNDNIYNNLNIYQVMQGVKTGVLRPELDYSNVPQEMINLIQDCWCQDPQRRPAFTSIVSAINSLTSDPDFMSRMMDKVYSMSFPFSGHSSDQSINPSPSFPPKIAKMVLDGIKVDPERFSNVSVLFADVVNMERLTRELPRQKFRELMRKLYETIDNLSKLHGVFRIHTNGGTCMVASGLYDEQHSNAASVAQFAVALLQSTREILLDEEGRAQETLMLRIGCHVGSVVASVVGNRKQTQRYCLFGSTITVASQLAATSGPNRIQLSAEMRTKLLSEANDEFASFIVCRGMVSIRGKGNFKTFWLDLPHHYYNPPDSYWRSVFQSSSPSPLMFAPPAVSNAPRTSLSKSSVGDPGEEERRSRQEEEGRSRQEEEGRSRQEEERRSRQEEQRRSRQEEARFSMSSQDAAAGSQLISESSGSLKSFAPSVGSVQGEKIHLLDAQQQASRIMNGRRTEGVVVEIAPPLPSLAAFQEPRRVFMPEIYRAS